MLLSESCCSHWLHRAVPQGWDVRARGFRNSEYCAVLQKIQDASSGANRNLDRAWVLAAPRQEEKKPWQTEVQADLWSICHQPQDQLIQAGTKEWAHPSIHLPSISVQNSFQRFKSNMWHSDEHIPVSFQLEYPRKKRKKKDIWSPEFTQTRADWKLRLFWIVIQLPFRLTVVQIS